MNMASLYPRISGLLRASALQFLLTIVIAVGAHGQTFSVLHRFTGGVDGGRPGEGLTLDAAGNLYGTTSMGGDHSTSPQCSQYGCGLVFRMKHGGSGWTLAPLHNFNFYDGGGGSTLVFGPGGALYGTSFEGGDNRSLGLVFSLRPPGSFCHSVSCPWNETVIYRFNGTPDGANPVGDLFFDATGNVYGTTDIGGINGRPYGTIYKLSRAGSGWNENVEYSFSADKGYEPSGGVLFDSAGNIYVTTNEGPGGNNCGAVSQLVPSGSGWTQTVLHSFDCNSYSYPQAGLVMDRAGNLYGALASSGHTEGGGAVFEMTAASGYHDFQLLHTFDGNEGPITKLTLDAAGNLYGTTMRDGLYGWGNIFKLSPSQGGWTYTSLHDFTGGADGAWPTSEVSIDANGNLYGTAEAGGGGTYCPNGCGVVWEITP